MSADDRNLMLLVGAPRSGTTLLRLILDSHSAIGCPAEAGIPALISHLGRVWWTINPNRAAIASEAGPEAAAGEESGRRAAVAMEVGATDWTAVPREARNAIRAAVLAPMNAYCSREGKQIYCDKSLDSVFHLEAVRTLFPQTRYVLLFRHVMDKIASGLEASPWGFQAFGYTPYVQASPDNFVVALARYWLNHVEAALSWEATHGELCHRVRYEDLATEPEKTVTTLFRFLEMDVELATLKTAIQKSRFAVGPGDYKVTYSAGVHSESIGRGRRIPISLLPEPLLAAVNEKLGQLGYELLDERWNTSAGRENSEDGTPNDAGRWLAAHMQQVSTRLRPSRSEAAGTFALVSEDHGKLRWVVDPQGGEVRQGDGDVEWALVGNSLNLVALLRGDAHPGALLRTGRLRHLTARQDVAETEVVGCMRTAVRVLGEAH